MASMHSDDRLRTGLGLSDADIKLLRNGSLCVSIAHRD
jgi:hypothetical protein